MGEGLFLTWVGGLIVETVELSVWRQKRLAMVMVRSFIVFRFGFEKVLFL